MPQESMQQDNATTSASVSDARAGLSALTCMIGVVLLGGRAISALVTGQLKFPFVAAIIKGEQPLLFHGIVLALGVTALVGLCGAYLYWREWRTARA